MSIMDQDAIFDPNDIHRSVFGLHTRITEDAYYHPPHSHRKAQLVFAARGTLTCEVNKGLWIVPPQHALFVPGGVEHSLRGIGKLDLYIVFVDPAVRSDQPTGCCTIGVSPLLRELVCEVASLPLVWIETLATRRLVDVLLDRLCTAPVEQLHLPMPSDPRLRKVAMALQANPDDRASAAEWSRRVGLSERTLFRMVLDQTGMSFGRWRQQIQILLALERLAQGMPVQAIATDLGYQSTGAFITMFKKTLGLPPTRYLASRRGQSGVG